MRYIPIQCIKEGMIVGRTVYGKNNIPLIVKGNKIKKEYIYSLLNLNINGVYIDDDISKNIEIIENIKTEIKNKAIITIKQSFKAVKGTDLIKPINEKEKIKLENLVDEIVDELIRNDSISVNIIDLKIYDEYTFYHSINVMILSIIIGRHLKFKREELKELALAAILHDVGKVFSDKKIINKKGTLLDSEKDEIKKHPENGYLYLKNVYGADSKIYNAVLQHHEKWDGTGYPRGTKGENITLLARIISICDVYDALISDRPYRDALLPSEAIELIISNTGISFDPELVTLFYHYVYPYPSGTIVELSNKSIGIVHSNNNKMSLRPVVKILEEKGEKVKPYLLDLTDKKTLSITIIKVLKTYMC